MAGLTDLSIGFPSTQTPQNTGNQGGVSYWNAAVGPGHPDYQGGSLQQALPPHNNIRSIMPMPPHFGLWPPRGGPRPIQPKVPWEEFGEQMGGFGETLGGYSSQFDKFGEQLGGLGEQMTGYQDALGSFNEQMGGMGKQFETVNNKLDSVEKGIANLGNQLQPRQQQYQNPYSNFYSNPFGFGGLGSLFGRRY